MGLAVPLARRVAELRGSVAAPRDGGDTAVSAVAREASVTALERGETHYTDRPGIVPLRQRVTALMSERFGLSIDAGKGVVITCGVTEARFVAMQQLVPVGGTVVALSHAERIAGACIVRGAGLGAPDAAVDGDVTVYLTGDTPDAVRDPWLAQATEHGWAVVYEPGDGSFHPAVVGLADQTVTIGALGLEAGIEAWRVGYLAAPAATAGPLRDFKQALTLCTTNLSQWGALALLEEANA